MRQRRRLGASAGPGAPRYPVAEAGGRGGRDDLAAVERHRPSRRRTGLALSQRLSADGEAVAGSRPTRGRGARLLGARRLAHTGSPALTAAFGLARLQGAFPRGRAAGWIDAALDLPRRLWWHGAHRRGPSQ